METLRAAIPTPLLVATAIVALLLVGLLVGFEPVSGDPDRMYRPLKAELARSLREGRPPYWSDRFGLGVPLVAESHVAAFYPPNWLLYRALDVSSAYRLAMWLHYVALVIATYAYARELGIKPWGAAISGVSFTLCGFQAIHSSHEPFYHALPYLPLILWMAERYLKSGRIGWVAILAVCFGLQLTIGHFQLQMWTAGLVTATALWRVVVDREPWLRGLGLATALAWGAAIAAVQLGPTWELVRFVGFTRTSLELSFFAFPPSHWIELAIPRLFSGLRGGPEDAYWYRLGTTGYEACLYVGTIPLILAFAGLTGDERNRRLNVWLPLIPISLALATLPRWWPEGYSLILSVPGFGSFRSPGRYTLLTSLGLALLAGQGFDRLHSIASFRAGLMLALLFAASAMAVGFVACSRPEFLARRIDPDLTLPIGSALAAWVVGIAALLAWRSGSIGPWAPLIIAGVELGALYYTSTTEWGWAIPLPEASPILARLATEPGVVRVAGHLDNLPARGGVVSAWPYLGITLPPPHKLLETSRSRALSADPLADRWLRRFGVTHGVWDGPDDRGPGTLILETSDTTLDRLVYREPGGPRRPLWRIVKYEHAYPPARIALRVAAASDLRTLWEKIAFADESTVYTLSTDPPLLGPERRARSARVVRAEGASYEVESDGVCLLVLNRTYYPGWTARVNDGPPKPVDRVDGGLQAIRIEGEGKSRIAVEYRPTGAGLQLAISIAGLAAAGSVLVWGFRRRKRVGREMV